MEFFFCCLVLGLFSRYFLFFGGVEAVRHFLQPKQGMDCSRSMCVDQFGHKICKVHVEVWATFQDTASAQSMLRDFVAFLGKVAMKDQLFS